MKSQFNYAPLLSVIDNKCEVWVGDEIEFNALPTKDYSTVYFVDSAIYRGETCISDKSLSDLSDVTISTPEQNDILAYDNGWTNSTINDADSTQY